MCPHQTTRATSRCSTGVEAWRREQLVAAGFDGELAHALATDRRVDLHAALDLIDRGCPPELAARILAPLDPVPPGEGSP